MTSPRNHRLNCTTASEVMQAFDRINSQPRFGRIQGKGLPEPATVGGVWWGRKHLQGVALCNSSIIVARNNLFFRGMPEVAKPLQFHCGSVHWDDDHKFDHFGGIQCIGADLFAVGDGTSGCAPRESEIRLYGFSKGLRQGLSPQVVIPRPNSRAGAVGITDFGINNDEKYLLGVYCNARIEFYCTNGIVPLHGSGNNSPFGKKPFWVADIDDRRRDYANGISLVADSAGGVYLIGFMKTNLLWGNHIADLYQVNLNRGLTRLATFTADCDDGASFRWGASAYVTDKGTITIVAIERNVQIDRRKRTRYVRLNVFE